MRYQYHDGFTFEADTPQGICQALKDSMRFQFDATLEDWIREHAERCRKWNGKNYSAESAEAHAADLLRHGIIQKLEEAE